jgi:Glycosyl hydrolase family 53
LCISMTLCFSLIGFPVAGQPPASNSAAGRLELVGVTPYSNLQTSFSDASGKKYPHFIALARAAGANAVRLYYKVGEDRTDFYAQAEEVKKRGMRMVCTIYVDVDKEKDFASVLAATERQCQVAYGDLQRRSLMPALLLVGNEINTSEGHINRWASWKTKEGDFMTHVAASLNAGAKGLRAAGYKGDIGVHIDRSWAEFYTGLIERGYTDYQVVAISVYPKWGDTKTTVDQKIQQMHVLATKQKKKILVIETAAPYVDKGKHKTQDFDPELVVEVSPRGQALHLEKVCKLVLAIPEGRGLGVITWGSDLTTGIHKWDHVTWNRAQVTKERVALPSLYVLGKYAKLAEPKNR